MTQRFALICLASLMLFTVGCKDSDKTLETDEISKQFAYNLDEVKSLKYDNLDLKNVSIKLPDNLNEIYNLKLDTNDTVSDMTNQEYLDDFINQLEALFPDEEIKEEYIHFQADGEYDDLGDAYPALSDFKERVLSDDININMLDYRSPYVYLCNFKYDVMIPQRMNKGTGVRLSVSEEEYQSAPDFYLGAWTCDKYQTETERFVNNGQHDDEKYTLSGEEVSVGEAVDYFENEYYATLPFQYSEDLAFEVSEIGLVKFADHSYGYNLYATVSYNGI